MNNLKYNKIDTKVNFSNLKLDKELGHGAFGSVYEATNGKTTNKRLVVKKTKKTIGLQLFSLLVNGKFQGTMFDKEVKALKYLSKLGIAPKIYYSDKGKMIYVIEKLDTTLFELLKYRKFNNNHLKELTKTLKKVTKTPFIHNDLHEGNIMYSKKSKKFFIIDWGIFILKEKCLKSKKTKKTKTKNKSSNCYNLNSSNVGMLSDVFTYVDIEKEKFKNKTVKDFLKLFNLNTMDEVKHLLNIQS